LALENKKGMYCWITWCLQRC